MDSAEARQKLGASRKRLGIALVGTVAVVAAVIATAGAADATQVRTADTTPPSAPTITSTDYPVNGPTTVTFGHSGRITLTATDPGPNASGVAGFAYNLDGSGVIPVGVTLGSANTIRAKAGKANLSIPLSWLHFGTNTLVAQTLDGAGLVSPSTTYNFFIADSVFPPPVAGDADGDGVPDLVTVDAAGNVRLFSNPGSTTVDPTGDTGNDPQQYGGVVAISGLANGPINPTNAGTLVVHSGSFANRSDDLFLLRAGVLDQAVHVGGPPTQWTGGAAAIGKPSCAACANYNSVDWSSVTQMVAVRTTQSAAPNLLTVEVVNNVASVWLYPAGAVPFFQSPTAISVSTGNWHWDDLQIIGASVLPGSTGPSMFVRNPDTGTLYVLHDISSGIADPAAAAVIVGTGFNASAYPLMTMAGDPDANGALSLWATTADGRLAMIPTNTTSAGVTTVRSAQMVSGRIWASREMALGSSYPLYNNSGVAATGTPNAAFDTVTTNSFAYNADALGNATLDPSVLLNDGAGGCPPGWTTCVPGLGSSTGVFLPNVQGSFDGFTLAGPWANRRDNYAAAGQLLPVPSPTSSSGPAQFVRFLGAADTTDAVNGASVSATLTYTDGHTQTITIAFANWTQDISASPVAGNTVVATMDHRTVAATGANDPTANYLFATPQIALLDNGTAPTNQEVASVRLGTNPGVHIFAITSS